MAVEGPLRQPPPRRVRIMHLLPIGHPGGGPETVRLLAHELSRKRFEVSVVCPDSPMMDRFASIPDLKRFSCVFPTFPTPAAVRRLAALIQAEGVDILHTHLFHGDLYGFLATRLAPVPLLVSTVQGINFSWETERFPRRMRSWIASRFYRGIYRAFDGIVSCSEAVRNAICSRPGVKVRREHVHVIHNSVDIQETIAAAKGGPGPDPFFSSHGVSTRKRLIVVANFDSFKGHRVLLEALHRLKSELPFECILVGNGPDRPIMEAMTRSLGLTDCVRFLGYRDDVPALLRQSDLFVFPSLWEPFGIAAVEAMLLGVPVVACAAGGIKEIITDGETGVLIRPGDPVALVEGIRRALTEPFLAVRIVSQARKAVESRFDARGMVSAYERWYEELMVLKGLVTIRPPETVCS